MPWTMDNYPDSLKNLDEVTRKKAIDMANAMVDEGYEEGRAIPIATAQAEKWYDNASKKEKEDYMKEGDPATRSKDTKKKKEKSSKSDSNKQVLEVVASDDGWAVQKKGKKQPDKTFSKKSEAEDYAKKEAKDSNMDAVIYKENGEVQHQYSYSNDN